MDSVKNKDLTSRLHNSKGFTLIEMAIVLVIIGIILGAVVKGQDLISNARAKQLTSAVNTWRSLAYAYMDRNGRLPGDAGRDGVIGNAALTEQIATGTATSEIATTMQNAPTNPVVIGSMSFWIYFGNVAGLTGFRNGIFICKDAACSVAFTTDELEIIKSVDTALDGVADAGLGQFRGIAATPSVTALAAVVGTAQVNSVITAGVPVSIAVNGATTLWDTAPKAAVWSFDRPF
jgi:prepilin-type N-terminal cleavage/methylation domain-containing protein